jgi:hypothetical protein
MSGTRVKDYPYFETWSHENLAKFAKEQYEQNIALNEALAQLRLDLKDAIKLMREANARKTD